MAYGNTQIQRMPAAQVPQYGTGQASQRGMFSNPTWQAMQRSGRSPFMGNRNQRGGGGMRPNFPSLRPPTRAPQTPGGTTQTGPGGAFQGNDPWGNDNFNDADNQWGALLNYLVQQGGKAGAYTGDGSQLMDPFKEAYQHDMGAGVRNSQLAGASGTMDPSQVALLSRLKATDAGSNASNAMSQARLQLLQDRQRQYQQYLQTFMDYNTGASGRQQSGEIQRQMQNDQRGGGFGAFAGNILGRGLGAATGRWF